MKLKYVIIAIASLGAGLSSCSGFLEQYPQNNLSEADFYKTAADFTSAVNGAYSTLQETDLLGNWYVFAEVPSDNTHEQLSGTVTDQDEFDQFYIRTLNPYIASFWNTSYKAINRTNTVLGRIDAIDMDAALKARYKLDTSVDTVKYHKSLIETFGKDKGQRPAAVFKARGDAFKIA